MDLDKTNQWLTLAANIGVLLSILLVAYELRQNTTTLRADAYQSRTENIIQTYSLSISPELLLSAMEKMDYLVFRCDPNLDLVDNLTAQEKIVMGEFLSANWARLNNLVYQYEEGNLDDGYFDGSVLDVIYQYEPWLQIFSPINANYAQETLQEYNYVGASDPSECRQSLG